MVSYDEKHWEILIDTIIERIGVDRFLDMTAYVLEQRGEQRMADHLAAVQLRAASAKAAGVLGG